MQKAEPQHNHAQQPTQRQGKAVEPPQGEQYTQLEAMVESSPQTGKLAQLAATANTSPQAVAQRRMMDMIGNSPRMAAQRKAVDAIHTSPHLTAQRQQIDTLAAETAQREEMEEPLQPKIAQRAEAPAKPNNTGLPDNLKSGIESLSGISMDNVKVHYNSSQPAQLNALAYAQGTDIHVAPGQEQHLPHEAWHVVQQAQGRVRPTMQMKEGVSVNDDKSLEHEADVMGAKVVSLGQIKGKSIGPDSRASQASMLQSLESAPAQRVGGGVVVQRALPTVADFEASSKYSEINHDAWGEYWLQLHSDLKDYHELEYDLEKAIPHELEVKYEARKEMLYKVILSCDLITGGGANPSKEKRLKEMQRWNAVMEIVNAAKKERDLYYKNPEGYSALYAELDRKRATFRKDVYTVDALKKGANLSMVSANMGEMGDVVGKLKAFHAVKEVANEESTRIAKLQALDTLLQRAKEVKGSQKTSESYWGEGPAGKFKEWFKSRDEALDNLIEMLQSNRERYTDHLAWRLNLQDVRKRNEAAAEGHGVSTTEVEEGWVDVDDGDRSKEMEAETDEIVKRLSGGSDVMAAADNEG